MSHLIVVYACLRMTLPLCHKYQNLMSWLKYLPVNTASNLGLLLQKEQNVK